MKKFNIIIILFAMALLPQMTIAQTAIDHLYEKYSGKPGFTSINISPAMFQLFSGVNASDSSPQAQKALDAMKQLKGLKMLVYEPEDSTKVQAFYNEIKRTVPMNKYTELMSVNGEDGKINFLASQDKNGKIRELLMIIHGGDETMIMSLTGLIDMQTIAEISKSMNMKGMNDLQKLGEGKGKDKK
ncbi:hypothetical protein MNBD_BACTEROID07-890 [hydrothermal vent metagenome]|uniref:DUF4252 domain-containing protein n=1 Tax=hydrothermal vent metagenome TaxID=652676 RepID=A0A3B0UCT7_9ZZZZ